MSRSLPPHREIARPTRRSYDRSARAAGENLFIATERGIPLGKGNTRTRDGTSLQGVSLPSSPPPPSPPPTRAPLTASHSLQRIIKETLRARYDDAHDNA